MINALRLLAGGMALSLTAGCGTTPREPIRTADHVDLQRFMGDWYVLANIPTFLERDAHNAVESYRLRDDGTVATTFSFRKGGFDGERKTYNPTGFIRDTQSNAVWGMRFVWPVKADYRVVFVDDAYTQTIIGRNKRDFVWIMARSPQIPPADMQRLVDIIAEQGYDTSKLQMVPQSWPEAGGNTGGSE